MAVYPLPVTVIFAAEVTVPPKLSIAFPAPDFDSVRSLPKFNVSLFIMRHAVPVPVRVPLTIESVPLFIRAATVPLS